MRRFILCFFLSVCTAFAGSSAFAASFSQTDNAKYTGKTLTVLSGKTISQCKQSCNSKRRCAGYTWSGASRTGTGRCALKSSLGRLQKASNSVSGAKVGGSGGVFGSVGLGVSFSVTVPSASSKSRPPSRPGYYPGCRVQGRYRDSCWGTVRGVHSGLNVRSGPSASRSRVGVLSPYYRVRIVGREGSWYRITSPIQGWVHSRYIGF